MTTCSGPDDATTREPALGATASRSRAAAIVLALLALLCAAQAVASLGWRIEHDAPLMMYVAFLMDEYNYVPYRDIFDFNLPGTYLFNLTVGRLFGYTDLGFRCADLVCLAVLFAASWVWLRQFGQKAALCACLLFGLAYFHFGPQVSMQREYVGLLPISVALAIYTLLSRHRPSVTYLLAGFLFGLSAIVKPPLAIGLPVVILFHLYPSYSVGHLARAAAWGLLGFAIPLLGTAVYLWHLGAWPDFVDIAAGYWPLYRQLGGDHVVRSGIARADYVRLTFAALAGLGFLLVPAALGAAAALRRPSLPDASRRLAGLLLCLAGVYTLYPLTAGKFWAYHWLPSVYFVAALAALCFAQRRDVVSIVEQRTLAVVLIVCTLVAASPDLGALRRVIDPSLDSRQKRVDEISSYLKEHLEPGDTVQPLDWAAGGAVQAMLAARARMATPFLYDFCFFHHVSEPYTQELRQRFVAAMQSSKPRYVIFMTSHPLPRGIDTTDRFPEVEELLKREYQVARAGDGYRILERKPTLP